MAFLMILMRLGAQYYFSSAVKKKGKIVPVINYLDTMTLRHMGNWKYSSTRLDFGNSWR
jgi:hypothetical protein